MAMPHWLRAALVAITFSSVPAMVVLFTQSLAAQVQYVNAVPISAAAPPVALTSAAFAPAPTGGLLLFGGTTSTLPQPFTYSLDNTTWTKQFSVNNPMSRVDASLMLDPVRANNVLFGGRNPLGTALNETWTWQNGQWSLLPLAIAPAPRSGHRMVFDPVANVGLLFGGKDALGTARNDFWQWNGTAWAQLTPATLPPARSLHGFAYDELRQRAVVYGGIDGTTRIDDVWEWDGAVWTQITPSSPFGIPWTPGARSGHTMAYDPRSERVVVHGGETANGCQQNVWSWDGTQWTLHTATTALPSARTGAALWYDSAANQLRLFGGGCGTSYTNDLWALSLPVYSRSSNYGQACIGSLGTPTISVTAPSAPILGTTVNVRLTNIFGSFIPAFAALGFQRATFAGIPLPLDLTVAGLPGCLLQNSADQILVLTPPSSGIVNWPIVLPNSAQLLGAELFLQGLGFEVPGYPRWGSMTDGLVLRLGDSSGPIPGSSGPLNPALNMVAIAPGTFQMGSVAVGGTAVPVHPVTISQPFWMGRDEVTQAQYQAVMGNNPSYFVGTNRPVEQVSWNSAVAYCDALTVQEAAAGRLPVGYEYRLPTEAEWEYCCRAWTTTEWNVGSSLSCLQANFYDNGYCVPPGQTSAVGSYAANAWGLRDMHGNVWEWCLDGWDGSANYPAGPVTDPYVLSSSGPYRVIRGGSWGSNSSYCRSAYRNYYVPTSTSNGLGFRVVCAPVLP